MSHWDFLEEYPKNKLHKALLDTIGTYENDTNNDPTILGYDHLAPRGDGRSPPRKADAPRQRRSSAGDATSSKKARAERPMISL